MKEEKSIVAEFLRYPSGDIVDLAIALANLTWQEELAISLCGRKGYTQAKASEKSGYSEDSINRWYRDGMKKLAVVWNGKIWIEDTLHGWQARRQNT